MVDIINFFGDKDDVTVISDLMACEKFLKFINKVNLALKFFRQGLKYFLSFNSKVYLLVKV